MRDSLALCYPSRFAAWCLVVWPVAWRVGQAGYVKCHWNGSVSWSLLVFFGCRCEVTGGVPVWCVLCLTGMCSDTGHFPLVNRRMHALTAMCGVHVERCWAQQALESNPYNTYCALSWRFEHGFVLCCWLSRCSFGRVVVRVVLSITATAIIKVCIITVCVWSGACY